MTVLSLAGLKVLNSDIKGREAANLPPPKLITSGVSCQPYTESGLFGLVFHLLALEGLEKTQEC